MTAVATSSWSEANQRYLMAALAEIRFLLERHVPSSQSDAAVTVKEDIVTQDTEQAYSNIPVPPTLETLCALFGLSSFERKVLLLCAGIELDGSFASVCAAAQGDPRRTYPTFSLALAAFPDAHWSALIPDAPLRYWKLIEIGNGEALTASALRIDERILHFLAGISHMDDRLTGIVESIPLSTGLTSSHERLAESIVQAWSKAPTSSALPVIQLCGNEKADKYAIAAAACAKLGINPKALSALSVPTALNDLDSLIRLWEREAALSESALILECGGMDIHDSARVHAVTTMIERLRGATIVSVSERLPSTQRPVAIFEVGKPLMSEQRTLWYDTLGSDADKMNCRLDEVLSHFDLSVQAIREIGREACPRTMDRENGCREPFYDFEKSLWDACRKRTRPRLDGLAQRIEPAAGWDDLVLPEQQKQILREVAIHVRRRAKVYDSWGFGARSSRGLGISALFEGASGTGKTMAAEVLANELRLDLYRIDLSSTVSKYIGETEKNLRRIFDAAEESGAILLFDEADALFGKRSEIKDSHDRYANIEVSYLLQRMEAYRGVAILTTNMKSALDLAFLRRIRFVIQFPFPDAVYRAEIWKRIFPDETPTEGLDMNKLARLNIAGGNIRNIALNAAFLAADDGGRVRMEHLLRAARSEYVKMEKPLSSTEIGGWV